MTKEKSCLVTQNLVGSINWYLTAPSTIIKVDKGGDGKLTWKDKALKDLKSTLSREKTPMPEAAKKGIEFENMVYKMVGVNRIAGSELFQKVCRKVEGFKFYKKAGINVEIGDHNCYLYGKYDAIKSTINGTQLIDLKTTAKYQTGKYLKGFQHKLYCYISGASHFKYVIAEWDEYPKIKAVHEEIYIPEKREFLKNEVEGAVIETLDIIKDLGFWDLYKEKYCLY